VSESAGTDARRSVPADTLAALFTELHRDEYRDVVKYLVVHPMANGLVGVKAEHPARDRDLVGRGLTWVAAAADLLWQVREEVTRVALVEALADVARTIRQISLDVTIRRAGADGSTSARTDERT
jgi:hypothetical protein